MGGEIGCYFGKTVLDSVEEINAEVPVQLARMPRGRMHAWARKSYTRKGGVRLKKRYARRARDRINPRSRAARFLFSFFFLFALCFSAADLGRPSFSARGTRGATWAECRLVIGESGREWGVASKAPKGVDEPWKGSTESLSRSNEATAFANNGMENEWVDRGEGPSFED